MPIQLTILKEKFSGEQRVALTPEVAGRLIKQGFEIIVETGAGLGAHYPDTAYAQAGAKIGNDWKTLLAQTQILLKVQPIEAEEIAGLAANTTLIGFMAPHRHPERIEQLKNKKIATFAMEKIPRVTRAQVMDALSSQATVAGYKAVLLAAELSPRFFPMLTTAAGTIRPAKVLILGAGVAGLMAIATARRLGAVVEAYDVRTAVKEQVESLGARWIDVGGAINAETSGGYARELTTEEKKLQEEKLATHIAGADVVITTAQIPGKPAPRLIHEPTVARMKPGSVVIDMAAESGGNVAGSRAGETVVTNGIKIAGPLNLPSQLPIHASEMYAKNISNFLLHLTQEGKSLQFNFADEIVAGALLTGGGA